MQELHTLLENNRKWAERTQRLQPDFFKMLARGQNPAILWIGCSDSRVPPNTIVDLPPGSIFVYRNIANQTIPNDLGSQAVICYAVQTLRVEHIVVCGHYGCGGVAAAMEKEVKLGSLENWLSPLRQIFRNHAAEMQKIDCPRKRWDRLCELNVAAQAANLCRFKEVQTAWKNTRPLRIHGWMFHLSTGRIKDLNLTFSGICEGRNKNSFVDFFIKQ